MSDFHKADIETRQLEMSIVGALLVRPDVFCELDVGSEDFCYQTPRQVFEAISQMTSADEVIDVITVAERLERELGKNFLPVIGPWAQDALAPANAAVYAKALRKRSNSRRAREILNAALSSGVIEDDLIDQTARELIQLTLERRNYECSISEALSVAIDRMEELAQEDKPIPGIRTGLGALDELLGGLFNSDLYILGARPSMGKTAALVNFAYAANKAVGIISAEQPRDQLGTRFMAVAGDLSSNKMRNGRLREEDWPRVVAVSSELARRQIRMFDKPAPTIREIERVARSWKHQHGIRALYVDYLQKIHGTQRNQARYDRVGEVASGLKNLARELDIPVLVLSQLNRELERRTDKRPVMSDLKDSGEIEQEADTVILLYREEVYDNKTPDAGIAEFRVAKNRHGPTGKVVASWHKDFMQFEGRDKVDDERPF